MNQLNDLWIEKIDKLSDKIRRIVRGDDDLYQEGVLGLREGLLRNPNATDAYLISAAKWAISHYRNRGVSMDNGPKWEYRKKLVDGTVRKYRKDTLPIYIDKLTSDFELEFLEYDCAPDIGAIDRICAANFYSQLDSEEARLVDTCIQTYDRYFYSSRVMRKLGMSHEKYTELKRSVYEKFLRTFGTDEDIEILDQEVHQ